MFSQISASARGSSVPSVLYAPINVSIATASESFALRARMNRPQLRRDTLFRRSKSFLHMFRRGPARYIVTREYRRQLQRVIKPVIGMNAADLQLAGAEILQLTTFLDTQPYSRANLFVGAAEGRAPTNEVAGGSHGVHETRARRRLHPFEIELDG